MAPDYDPYEYPISMLASDPDDEDEEGDDEEEEDIEYTITHSDHSINENIPINGVNSSGNPWIGKYTEITVTWKGGSTKGICVELNGQYPVEKVKTSEGLINTNCTNEHYIAALNIGGGPGQIALWIYQNGGIAPGYTGNYVTPEMIEQIANGESGTCWLWQVDDQHFVTVSLKGPPSKSCSGCNGGCNTSCEHSCSPRSCSVNCMNGCQVACDQSCSGACIKNCNDHCYNSCKLACAGCKDLCTACDQSCKDECIVTCSDRCSSCRTSCSGLSTSDTSCNKLCRSCDTMCINTCVNSCITWNSGGVDSAGFRSNSTNNNWRGFSANIAPRNGGAWYGPTTNGYSATSRSWSTTPNLYPTKTNVPNGYGMGYSGVQPTTADLAAGVGKAGGGRGDYDYSDKGEQEWYHTTERPDDDIDWDKDHNL